MGRTTTATASKALTTRRSAILVAGYCSSRATMDILFYDGHCGLCHSAVRFVAKHDRSGRAFRFAPLYGKTFEATVRIHLRAGLCNSMVVQTDRRLLLMRSDAWLYILQRLGGRWKILAATIAVI